MSRLLIISIAAGVVAAMVANQKGRNWLFWGGISALFPFMLIVLLLLPPALASGLTKKCSYCAEIIRHEATVCKHCHKELPIEMRQCPNCGMYVPDKDYCTECNRSLRR
jgi:hypothetical protein